MHVRLSETAREIMKDRGLAREVIKTILAKKSELGSGQEVKVDGKYTLKLVSSATKSPKKR